MSPRVQPVIPAVVPPVAAASPVLKPVVKPTVRPRALRILASLGMASWYGSALHGHRTASGEIFDKAEMTACHPSLPFGTMVKVIDVVSGRSVVVRINDRGSLAPGRIIDLSASAATALGMLRTGVAKVRLEILPPAKPAVAAL